MKINETKIKWVTGAVLLVILKIAVTFYFSATKRNTDESALPSFSEENPPISPDDPLFQPLEGDFDDLFNPSQ